MNRELQNMSEESLQNLEEIVETELLTVEDIRERLDTTEKGKIRQSIQNCKYVLEHDPCLKGAICRNEMTCQIDIMKKMPWKRRGVHMTDTDMNNLALYLEKNYGLTSDRVIAKAIDIVANENSFHPILEYSGESEMGWYSENSAYADTFLWSRRHSIYRRSDEDAHDGCYPQVV